MSKKVVIFGAGYAGIEAALTIQRKKRKSDDIEITLIDKNPYHTLLTELHEVAGNRISEDGIIVPLKDIFKYTDVKLIKDEISNIDFESKKLIGKQDEYKYDYLIIAAGSVPNYYGIEGMEEHSFPLWSYKDAIRVRERIKEMFILASQEKDAIKRKSLLTFVVGGGGFTGVEMMGELALWVNQLCDEHNLPRDEVRLVLIEALPNILNNLKPNGIKKSTDYLTKKLKVEVLLNKAIVKLDENQVELKDGTVIPTKTLIWTAGVRASNITDKLNIDKGRAARITVDENAQTQYEGVYAAGDVSLFTTPQGSLPALVEAAIQTGKGAAKNVLNDIRGKQKEKIEPKLHGVMVSVGSYFAASDLMGHEFPRLISIIMKYLVNIHYLFGIGGFELVFKYLKHEFLHKKQYKTIIENHISVVTPALWLVPIRLFLGYSWFMEGFRKIQEGWLKNIILAGSALDGASGASAAADAASSASTAAGDAVAGTFSLVASHTPQWYAWIVDNLIVPNALLFQWFIVIGEIAIGLALISGTFTFIAALGSLALNINFLLSTGMYPETWWYIPAALCLLGGAGRAFGVDHYLIPYLMRQWRYFVRNNKIKLWLSSK